MEKWIAKRINISIIGDLLILKLPKSKIRKIDNSVWNRPIANKVCMFFYLDLQSTYGM